MLQTIQDLFKDIENNSLIVTLFSGGIIVTLFIYAKNIIATLWDLFLTLISFKIVNRYNIQYFEPDSLKKVMFLLNQKGKILWMNQVEVMNSNAADGNENKYSAVPHGRSYRIMYNRFVIVDKEFENDGMKVITTVTIRVFFSRKKPFLDKFISDMKDIVIKENADNTVISTINTNGTNTIEKSKRFIDSIYSSDNAPLNLLMDAKNFIHNEKIYKDCSMPYKRNYLLYGKPGSGKTSSILALASELDWSVLCIDIAKNRLDDVIRNITTRDHTIFLFEDVDAVAKNVTNKKKKDKDGDEEDTEEVFVENDDISLSQLLNITDGLITPYGSICVFTTNHIECLDEAFLRDGRMDRKIEFKYFKPFTTKQMIKDKLGFELEDPKDEVCPASLQESILQVKLGNKTKEQFINEWSK